MVVRVVVVVVVAVRAVLVFRHAGRGIDTSAALASIHPQSDSMRFPITMPTSNNTPTPIIGSVSRTKYG